MAHRVYLTVTVIAANDRGLDPEAVRSHVFDVLDAVAGGTIGDPDHPFTDADVTVDLDEAR